MGWVYRKADQHECQKPELPGRLSYGGDILIWPGDVWQCDDAMCGIYWVVVEDQRDGLYWSRANAKQISQALGA